MDIEMEKSSLKKRNPKGNYKPISFLFLVKNRKFQEKLTL